MFGRNKANQEDMIDKLRGAVEAEDRFFESVMDAKEGYDAGIAVLEESYRQMKADVGQVRENIGNAALMAEENTKVEAALSRSILGCADRIAEQEDRQQAMIDTYRKVAEEAGRLVEENKHFTAPSKYLSEFAAESRSHNDSLIQKLTQMADYGKQMGVLALNAAIEAGRMGESGMQFVSAAEDIRSYAGGYDRAVRELRGELDISNRRIEKLEEQVRHLVSLLKENNLSTAKLMKTCQETVRQAEKNKPAGLPKEVEKLREQVLILKNADEEIIKSEERNRIQTEDLEAEFETQQQNQKELFSLMDSVFDHAAERSQTD